MNNHPWETGTDEMVTAIVRFDPEVSWWAARLLGAEATTGEPLEVELPVANRDSFVGWILGFGAMAEVLGPEELRSRLREQVEAALTSSA